MSKRHQKSTFLARLSRDADHLMHDLGAPDAAARHRAAERCTSLPWLSESTAQAVLRDVGRIKRKDVLDIVARDAGFENWAAARRADTQNESAQATGSVSHDLGTQWPAVITAEQAATVTTAGIPAAAMLHVHDVLTGESYLRPGSDGWVAVVDVLLSRKHWNQTIGLDLFLERLVEEVDAEPTARLVEIDDDWDRPRVRYELRTGEVTLLDAARAAQDVQQRIDEQAARLDSAGTVTMPAAPETVPLLEPTDNWQTHGKLVEMSQDEIRGALDEAVQEFDASGQAQRVEVVLPGSIAKLRSADLPYGVTLYSEEGETAFERTKTGVVAHVQPVIWTKGWSGPVGIQAVIPELHNIVAAWKDAWQISGFEATLEDNVVRVRYTLPVGNESLYEALRRAAGSWQTLLHTANERAARTMGTVPRRRAQRTP